MNDDTAPSGNASPSAEMAEKLGLNKAQQSFVNRYKWYIAIVALVVFGSIGLNSGSGAPDVSYRTAPVTQGDLTVTVTATGTIQPLNQVDVGAEISGLIEVVNVDFNDRVSLGQTLAVMDKDQLSARVRQTEAQLISARAKVEEAKASEFEARNNLRRAESLHKKGNVSEQSLDNASAAHARAIAVLASVYAQVTVAEANLAADHTNLAKTDITAPIDGIVLTRQVEPGQTVAASLQTPVLFTLAEDLSAMKLVVDIDEADIGQVKEGQVATFSVDAYAGRVFPATITSVRFAPKNEGGVVTYEALLSVNNSDLALRPGMTATATITTATRNGAVMVPYAALRFTPPMPAKDDDKPAARRGGAPGLMGMMMPRFNRNRGGRQTPLQVGAPGRVWVMEEGRPRAIPVEVGLLDGERAEVIADGIAEGTQVIIGIQAAG
ncbi:MAG: efflux RND transporter periplasmic adaptor subunit [Rhodospirillaceae bacterium]|jgi:HlyD family secretion protein|nr:efflux RND transporter periplasmic adaptor subunit [Rhodospirillaceae bacterium]MBT5566113.1 efflux RND transporter periplasmic adaptor subunit [Rhodospirillaceae bacterium]MBT6090630.1 efflux RND transporter periplasmic adaptor subunit [Rhodospirillaceae bacterium]MBT6960205.1 efflux RND transporter periplasmic adaptor subunit [Rhodospirillaceae bacterium]